MGIPNFCRGRDIMISLGQSDTIMKTCDVVSLYAPRRLGFQPQQVSVGLILVVRSNDRCQLFRSELASLTHFHSFFSCNGMFGFLASDLCPQYRNGIWMPNLVCEELRLQDLEVNNEMSPAMNHVIWRSRG